MKLSDCNIAKEFVDLKLDGYLYLHMTNRKAYSKKFNSYQEAYAWLFENHYHITIVVNEY